MANDSAVTPWTLTMPAGSLLQRLFTFRIPSTGAPYPISTSFEYVIRTTETGTGMPLVSLTTSSSADGVLAVDTSAGTVQMTMNPAATASLTPQQYFHSLWMDPGTASAFTWVTGALILAGNPQP